MSVHWRQNPSLKVEADSTEISHDSVSVQVTRPENAISRIKLVANDLQGKNFIGNLDLFDILKVSFRYGGDSWTQVFEGRIEDATPFMNMQGQKVACIAFGYGRALRNTKCDTNYGVESTHGVTQDDPYTILAHLIDNYVNKSFAGANTGYNLTYTLSMHSTPVIQFLQGNYRPNNQIINELCNLRTAHQAGSAGPHWFVDPSAVFRYKTITEDKSPAWPLWWNTDEAGSTLIEGKDFVNYYFSKNVTIQDFANKVILTSNLRKPGYDTWTESKAASWTGTNVNFGDVTVDTESGNTLYTIVGTNFLEMTPSGIPCTAYYPSTIDSDWDFTSVGAPHDPPKISFYAGINDVAMTLNLRLFTTDTTNYYQVAIAGDFPAVKVWRHFNLPIGPYAAEEVASESHVIWSSAGTPDWGNIDAVGFYWTPAVGVPIEYVWIDDLHFSGKIVREAYNSTNITANKEVQKTIRMDISVDDSMKASDDTGVAARLAYAELLRSQATPMVGTITTPGIVDILSGQKVHVHADKQSSGSFRVDSDFRVKVAEHNFSESGFTTTLQLTDDLANSFAKGPADLLGALKKAVFVDPEAKNLTVGHLDTSVPRLSVDYP